jgi:dihydrodipicolinate reductase
MVMVRARTVFSDQKLTVTAVESLELQTDSSNRRRFMIGSLKPIAVIVREPDRTYALDMGGQPVAFDRLNLPADFENG